MTPITLNRRDEARALIYRLLATGFLYPADTDWELYSESFAPLLAEAAADLGLELDAALAQLQGCWVREPDDAFLHAYTELFVNSPRGIPAPLNESVYFGVQPLVDTDRTREVARAYEAAGFTPAPEYRHLLPDHLSLELEFMAIGIIQGWETRAFFLAHVHSWQPRAAGRIIEARLSRFYAALARLLRQFLEWERRCVYGGTEPALP